MLLMSILLIALCGITYELIVGTISSYFLGNSVLEFSVTIGLFMSSMGLGSYLSKFFVKDLLGRFLSVEILIGLIGGLTSPMLFAVFATNSEMFRLAQVSVTLAIGLLVGLEIPLLTRYLRRYSELRVALAQVLSWDYLGALLGSIAFPVILLPQLGLIGSSLAVGLVNLAVAVIGVVLFRDELKAATAYIIACVIVGAGLLALFLGAGGLERYFDSQLYRDQIIYSQQTRYQKLVVTRWRDDIRLFINGNIQFSSVDEYRYHEALVHIPMASAAERKRILVLGGGDGLGIREVRKWGDVEEMVLVDLDPAMTELGRRLTPVVELNERALEDPRLTVVNDDAMNYLEKTRKRFDVILIDLPDPNHEALAKLYSRSFYRLARSRLTDGGVLATQSSSPYYSRRAFWCINLTIEQAFCPVELSENGRCPEQGFVKPYHVNVPSFGDWGFNIASTRRLGDPTALAIPFETRYLSTSLVPALFAFPLDQARLEVEPNRLINPKLLHYYVEGWNQWNL